jgi:hypothetical protein
MKETITKTRGPGEFWKIINNILKNYDKDRLCDILDRLANVLGVSPSQITTQYASREMSKQQPSKKSSKEIYIYEDQIAPEIINRFREGNAT